MHFFSLLTKPLPGAIQHFFIKLKKTTTLYRRTYSPTPCYFIFSPGPFLRNCGLDNCIQNFHLGRYIVGYTVGNVVLRRRESGAVKRDFRTCIRRSTSPSENFEYGSPNLNAVSSRIGVWETHKAARHPTRCDVINDVKLNKYCRNF